MKINSIPLDETDLKLLQQLMDQGRTTWAELGAILGLSPPAAADRVRRLEERGIIKGYSALVEPETVGNQVSAFIGVTLELPKHRVGFLERIKEMPEIQECHHVAGEGDYLLKVRASSIKNLEKIVSDDLKGLPGVVKTHTSIILSTLKETPVLPLPAWERKWE